MKCGCVFVRRLTCSLSLRPKGVSEESFCPSLFSLSVFSVFSFLILSLFLLPSVFSISTDSSLAHQIISFLLSVFVLSPVALTLQFLH